MPNPASPSPASPVRMELPEEIERAIEALTSAHEEAAADAGGWAAPRTQEIDAAYEALTAAILSRLREADSAAEDAWQDKETAIVAVSRQLTAALARVERLEKALSEAANWHDSAADDLAGLPQNSHTRWWRTVHAQRSDEIRSALSEAPSQGDQ